MNFKKTFVTSLVISGITFFSIQKNTLADRRDFRVINNTPLSIVAIYYKVAENSSFWSTIYLSRYIEGWTNTKIIFHDSSEACVYDIEAVYSDGSYDLNRADLCRIDYIEYTGEGGAYRPR